MKIIENTLAAITGLLFILSWLWPGPTHFPPYGLIPVSTNKIKNRLIHLFLFTWFLYIALFMIAIIRDGLLK